MRCFLWSMKNAVAWEIKTCWFSGNLSSSNLFDSRFLWSLSFARQLAGVTFQRWICLHIICRLHANSAEGWIAHASCRAEELWHSHQALLRGNRRWRPGNRQFAVENVVTITPRWFLSINHIYDIVSDGHLIYHDRHFVVELVHNCHELLIRPLQTYSISLTCRVHMEACLALSFPQTTLIQLETWGHFSIFVFQKIYSTRNDGWKHFPHTTRKASWKQVFSYHQKRP